ncbi:MAG: Maf family nucleotide pyrophosphatase [Bacteroides sp.]|nr:Maf family nucleotide pyrophosphatase [Bacteroides sp.]MCM1378848.1 Maf family nucleotide pyrophosphatase [Bacteroides sp.]MCM1445465.1 Maf family nucleotide pyrophosphatase [Prevotella sp.]
MNYILASGSPRRRELLAMLDVNFRVDTSRPVDEIVPDGLPADEVPAYLSRLKAAPYLPDLKPDETLITADTVVILGDRVIGKPHDADDARHILRQLAGQTHRVVTGVSIGRPDGSLQTFSETTEVEFDTLTDAEINYYVERYHPLDKAGAYGIQEWIGAAAVRGIRGSFYNVMGLPIHRLYLALKNPS